MTALEGAVVYEELGRALAPSPHFVSAVMSAGLILRAPAPTSRSRRGCRGSPTGDAILTTAWLEPKGGFGPSGVPAPGRPPTATASCSTARSGTCRSRPPPPSSSCSPAPATADDRRRPVPRRPGAPRRRRSPSSSRSRPTRSTRWSSTGVRVAEADRIGARRHRAGRRGTTTMLDGHRAPRRPGDRRGARTRSRSPSSTPRTASSSTSRSARSRRSPTTSPTRRRPSTADGSSCYEAAWALADGRSIDRLAPMAKLFAVPDVPRRHRDGAAGLRRRRLHPRVRHPALLPPGQAAPDLLARRPRPQRARRRRRSSTSPPDRAPLLRVACAPRRCTCDPLRWLAADPSGWGRLGRWPPVASPPARRATSTSATCAPRWWRGCSPGRRAAGSSCGWRTSTGSRPARRTSASQLADLAALGLDWDGEVVRQSERFDRYEAAIDRLDRGRARPTPATAPAGRSARPRPRPTTGRRPRAPTRAPAATCRRPSGATRGRVGPAGGAAAARPGDRASTVDDDLLGPGHRAGRRRRAAPQRRRARLQPGRRGRRRRPGRRAGGAGRRPGLLGAPPAPPRRAARAPAGPLRPRARWCSAPTATAWPSATARSPWPTRRRSAARPTRCAACSPPRSAWSTGPGPRPPPTWSPRSTWPRSRGTLAHRPADRASPPPDRRAAATVAGGRLAPSVDGGRCRYRLAMTESHIDGTTAIVLIAHGSRAVAANQAHRKMAVDLEAQLGMPVWAAFLELADPLIPSAIHQAIRPAPPRSWCCRTSSTRAATYPGHPRAGRPPPRHAPRRRAW